MEKNLKIKKHSAADLVCESIKTMISNGTWKYYQKIPSESELADTFGVNRLTVRIALQKLNALGVLDTRVGDGTYVCHFNLSQHIEDLSEFYMTPKLLEDVAEFRALFEVQCARLAVEKHTLKDLEQLEECCLQYEKALAEYYRLYKKGLLQSPSLTAAYDELNRADLAFHDQICAMTHNDLLIYAFAVAKPAILEYMSTISRSRISALPPDTKTGGAEGHWDLYNAIKERDFETCQRLYLDMIDFHNTTPYSNSIGRAVSSTVGRSGEDTGKDE